MLRYNYTFANLIPGEKYEWMMGARTPHSYQYNYTRMPLRLGK